MSDFIGDKRCVTHHYACDCREEKFRKLEEENKKLRRALLTILEYETETCKKFHRTKRPTFSLAIAQEALETS